MNKSVDAFKNKKNSEFLDLAFDVKKNLEAYLGDKFKKDYIYQTILELIDQVKNNQYPPRPRKTDVGIAAMKAFHFSGSISKELDNKISQLSELYRKLP